MTEIDFDELDRAVHSIMNKNNQAKSSGSSAKATDNATDATAEAAEATSVQASSSDASQAKPAADDRSSTTADSSDQATAVDTTTTALDTGGAPAVAGAGEASGQASQTTVDDPDTTEQSTDEANRGALNADTRDSEPSSGWHPDEAHQPDTTDATTGQSATLDVATTIRDLEDQIRRYLRQPATDQPDSGQTVGSQASTLADNPGDTSVVATDQDGLAGDTGTNDANETRQTSPHDNQVSGEVSDKAVSTNDDTPRDETTAAVGGDLPQPATPTTAVNDDQADRVDQALWPESIGNAETTADPRQGHWGQSDDEAVGTLSDLSDSAAGVDQTNQSSASDDQVDQPGSVQGAQADDQSDTDRDGSDSAQVNDANRGTQADADNPDPDEDETYLPTPTTPDPAPDATPTPIIRRSSGRFMDLVHTSSDMTVPAPVETPTPRQRGAAIAPLAPGERPIMDIRPAGTTATVSNPATDDDSASAGTDQAAPTADASDIKDDAPKQVETAGLSAVAGQMPDTVPDEDSSTEASPNSPAVPSRSGRTLMPISPEFTMQAESADEPTDSAHSDDDSVTSNERFDPTAVDSATIAMIENMPVGDPANDQASNSLLSGNDEYAGYNGADLAEPTRDSRQPGYEDESSAERTGADYADYVAPEHLGRMPFEETPQATMSATDEVAQPPKGDVESTTSDELAALLDAELAADDVEVRATDEVGDVDGPRGQADQTNGGSHDDQVTSLRDDPVADGAVTLAEVGGQSDQDNQVDQVAAVGATSSGQGLDDVHAEQLAAGQSLGQPDQEDVPDADINHEAVTLAANQGIVGGQADPAAKSASPTTYQFEDEPETANSQVAEPVVTAPHGIYMPPQSPFVPGVTVEKRPLGGAPVDPAVLDAMPMPPDPIPAVDPSTPSPRADDYITHLTEPDPVIDQSGQTAIHGYELPDELDRAVVAVESEAALTADPVDPDPLGLGDRPSSSLDNIDPSIFDETPAPAVDQANDPAATATSPYQAASEPLKYPSQRRSSGMVVVVVLLLVIAAIGGVAAYYFLAMANG